jgi:hypothetical protein
MDYVSFKRWHLNGEIKSEWSGGKTDSVEHDIDGNIILKNSDYKNGNFRKRDIAYRTELYNYEGEITVLSNKH